MSLRVSAAAFVLLIAVAVSGPAVGGTPSIVPSFDSEVTDDMKTAINYAVDRWNSWLAHTGTGEEATLEMRFRVSWLLYPTPLSTGLAG